MNNQIRDSLREVCQLLNTHQVEYMLVGGIAVGFYGFPRSTADIDFWYNPSIENFHKILDALKEKESTCRHCIKLYSIPKRRLK